MRLKDRVALVTGSGSGIGKAIAVAMANEGAKIVLNDINKEKLDQTLAEFAAKDVDTIAVHADVTSAKDVAAMVERIREHFGRVDILVNNAGGSMNHPIHLLDMTEEMWDQVVDLNLKGTFLVSREVLPLMIAQGKGNIVNIASQAGRLGNELTPPSYSAAKAAVLGLTRHMAREFGPQGIRVNAISPGYCDSGERIAQLWTGRLNREQLINTVALRRASVPEEQAAAVMFLASDESSYIAGANIDVSGGRVCF